jgi:type II restriction/modification system DNA methylase subunit YeeA
MIDNKIWFKVTTDEFKKIPGSPIAYWINKTIMETFSAHQQLSEFAEARIGLVTGDNEYYIRRWHETAIGQIGFGLSRVKAKQSKLKWFPYAKGGLLRKWYGNFDSVVNWENDGNELQTRMHSSGKRILAHNFNLDRIFKEGISWTVVTSSNPSFRYVPQGFLFDAAAAICQSKERRNDLLLSFLNSKIVEELISILNPTINLHPGYLEALPFLVLNSSSDISLQALEIAKTDWNSFETSWDFATLPLLKDTYHDLTLQGTYENLRSYWLEMTLEMQRLEEENNRIFIQAYGLEDELTPDVPLEEITLTCNPRYRYRGDKSDEELEVLLLADTMKEFISYAVGCMFGRYSLDKPGLILANQGDTYEDYKRLVPESSFPADKDNAIPILDGDWFADDIVSRFRRFLRVTFGSSHFEANLKFLEQALGKDIRQYFLKDFYNDHVQRYKKRPIYWMFSSPDGSFNVLIYMHRYNPDTVSIVRNEYLREYMSKLTGHIVNLQAQETNMSLTKGERTRALKEIDKINKIYDGLEKYEQDVIFPLATQRLEIDLDDGVKVNYPKFGAALKKIPGLEAKDEE